jgi:exodeoxyribonuclease VII large subunit
VRVLSVSEITGYIRELVEYDPILSDIWVRGEVSNFSRSAAGHMYFCLTSEGVQVNCVLFRGNQRGILAIPRNGDAVLAHGRVSIYEARGQYQLMVDNVAPEGIGILQLQFEETKRRLEADGLFAEERKRPLPQMPAVIGVVTSGQGAVWHDIQTVVARRFPLVELILAPSAVQGPNAADELIAGIEALQEIDRCDVIIVGRGGGAAEDLAPFSDERLARAIFASRVPIVSAVGHETDACIADLVADVRAPTPSAAAEMCVPNGRDLLAAAGYLVTRARTHTLAQFRDTRDTFDGLATRIDRRDPRSRIGDARQDIDALSTASRMTIERLLAKRREQITTSASRAALLDPRDILRRGYAIVTTPNGSADRRITKARDAASQSNLTITFSDGRVRTLVTGEQE